uniref:E2 ubiquitin-conjugating enzyme n=1 Tax=Romanomermis culicivorax TaxID=13658 RepID=A0A915JWQ6_ROMCU
MQSTQHYRTKGKFSFRSVGLEVTVGRFPQHCTYPLRSKVDFQAEPFKLLSISSVPSKKASFYNYINMSNIALQRVQKEFKEIITSDEVASLGIKIEMIDSSMFKLSGEILGPPETPYCGGTFKLSIDVPDNYPFQPPKVKFCTNIWHPNISSATGAICLDLLKDQWAASMTLRTILISIQSLLCSPEPNDPQDAVVARQYLSDYELFKRTARYWTKHFALAPGPKDVDLEKRIAQLTDMGYSIVKT